MVGLGLVTGYAAVVSGEDARSIKRSKSQASLVGCALDAVTMQARLKRFVAISPSRRQGKFRCYRLPNRISARKIRLPTGPAKTAQLTDSVKVSGR